MIIGIGTDIAAVTRFGAWQNKTQKQRLKIFSERELAACTDQNNQLEAFKLAARFAAKEAFFKAFSAACSMLGIINTPFSLLFVCNHVRVNQNSWGVPELIIDWQAFEKKLGPLPQLDVKLSLSHERDFALAFVIISKNV